MQVAGNRIETDRQGKDVIHGDRRYIPHVDDDIVECRACAQFIRDSQRDGIDARLAVDMRRGRQIGNRPIAEIPGIGQRVTFGIGDIGFECHFVREQLRDVLTRIQHNARARWCRVRCALPGYRQREHRLIRVITVANPIADAGGDALAFGQGCELQVAVAKLDRAVTAQAELTAIATPDPAEIAAAIERVVGCWRPGDLVAINTDDRERITSGVGIIDQRIAQHGHRIAAQIADRDHDVIGHRIDGTNRRALHIDGPQGRVSFGNDIDARRIGEARIVLPMRKIPLEAIADI